MKQTWRDTVVTRLEGIYVVAADLVLGVEVWRSPLSSSKLSCRLRDVECDHDPTLSTEYIHVHVRHRQLVCVVVAQKWSCWRCQRTIA